jgi:RimJ/RimL family protein N-acetyltransferase
MACGEEGAMLVGKRVAIRALEERDLGAIGQLLREDDVYKNYYAELELPRSEDDIREEFLARKTGFDKWAITTRDDELIGIVGVLWRVPQYAYHRVCRISLMLAKQYQQLGYGYEARLLITDRVFSQYNVHCIVGGYLSTNTASGKQARRVGARICGTIRETWFFDGAFHDITAWCLTRDGFYEACGRDLNDLKVAS